MATVVELLRKLFDSKAIGPQAGGHTIETKLGTAKSIFTYKNQDLEQVPAPATPFQLNGTLTPYSGPWTKAEAAHLLRRTGFGVKHQELELVLALGVNDAVDQVLTVPSAPPVPPINNYNDVDYTDPNIGSGDTWVNAMYDNDAEGRRIESWRGWWYQQMIDQELSVVERMTLFWHNHFSTQTEIVFWGRSAYELNSKLRQSALGNFKELTKTVTKDSMMLVYLNGYLNSKDAPDENYARELQELFTIGKDNPNHYTEDDVVAAARVLTGWRVNFDDNSSYHWPVDHDFSDKQFSAFYNNTVIQGSPDGDAELDALLNMIFAKNEVAEYICRKIYRWFVYYQIDANTEQNIIQPLAAIFRQSNYEIKPVLEALLKSEHFFEAAQSGCYIKTPVDNIIGNIRTFNVTIPGTTLLDNYIMKYYLTYFLSETKMLPGDPPNVAGWQAFRQLPQYYRVWINGDTLRARNSFTDVMVAYYLETTNDQMRIDPIAFVAQFPDVEDPNAVVSRISTMIFPKQLSAQKQFLLKSILLSGLANDSYWTVAWQDFINNPTDPMAFEVVNTRLVSLLLYMTRLPEFQLA
jgi:uncharacterized protein (DUF1800 family)